MPVKLKDQNMVWGLNAGMCAICKEKLIKSASNNSLEHIGEIAHIEGENPTSKRYNSGQTEDERNNPKNLTLLCSNHHTLIDKDDVEYTVEKLMKIRGEHLLFVSNAIKSELPNVTFAELEVILSYLVSSNATYDIKDSLEHITPREKIDKNKLSAVNAGLIAMGITKVKQVKNYLNSNPDVDFSERLRTRLSEYYNQEKTKESDPNIIFSNMLNYMSGESNDFKRMAAALAVLTYFFETCDIFEK